MQNSAAWATGAHTLWYTIFACIVVRVAPAAVLQHRPYGQGTASHAPSAHRLTPGAAAAAAAACWVLGVCAASSAGLGSQTGGELLHLPGALSSAHRGCMAR